MASDARDMSGEDISYPVFDATKVAGNPQLSLVMTSPIPTPTFSGNDAVTNYLIGSGGVSCPYVTGWTPATYTINATASPYQLPGVYLNAPDAIETHSAGESWTINYTQELHGGALELRYFDSPDTTGQCVSTEANFDCHYPHTYYRSQYLQKGKLTWAYFPLMVRIKGLPAQYCSSSPPQ